jgi:hypothetical protein
VCVSRRYVKLIATPHYMRENFNHDLTAHM